MLFYRAVVRVCYIFFRLFCPCRIIGKENRPTEPCVICANHTAYRDPILLAVALMTPMHFVAKSDLTRFAFFRLLFRLAGVIPITRGATDREAINKSCECVKNGGNLAIFPQGTRVKNTPPSPEQAKPGMALVASIAQAPILPVSIYYKDYNPRIFRKAIVVIGKPIPYSEYAYFMGDVRPTKQEISSYCFTKVCEGVKNVGTE